MKTKKEQAALEIVTHLTNNKHEAFFAGGYVRDMILGSNTSGDIDIATSATPQQISALFSHVIPVGEHFGVMIVVNSDIPFEVATFRKDIGMADGRHPESVEFVDAKEDALRRDFTINGMFYDPLADKVIDYVGGKNDLQQGIIRAIGNPALRFTEDYLRLIRAIRFSARFKFLIEKATWDALKEKAHGIINISPERIFQELDKILCSIHSDVAINLLHDSGLLAIILPEVDKLVGVEQPKEFHPEGDVFVHTIKALSLLKEAPSPQLGWSVLLHDIGKPATMVISDRIRFSNHDNVGAKMAEDVLRRLKASTSLIDDVVDIVGNHMNFMNVQKMRLSTLKKFLARPTLEDELVLHEVDCLASHGDVSNKDFIQAKQKELPVFEIKPEAVIGGKDLIALGYKPGPLFSKILGEAYDLQLENVLQSKENAVAWVQKNYTL